MKTNEKSHKISQISKLSWNVRIKRPCLRFYLNKRYLMYRQIDFELQGYILEWCHKNSI